MPKQPLTHLSLFSGIGGLDLAAESAGFVTVGQCEWVDYPTKILEKHWPNVPRWRDIRTLTKESFYARTGLRTVDLISGGFPCQPFSTAGKRRGKEDDRYLWPEMLRIIEEIQPRWVVGENVAGIISLALDQVLSDLESKGYETRAVIIPACGVDAPHRRDRVAIMGYAKHDGFPAATVCGSIDATSCDKPERPDTSGKSAEHDLKHGNLKGVVMYATPQARDYRTGQTSRWENPKHSRNLNDQCGGQLNPDWVEWLMGFPVGWTSLTECRESQPESHTGRTGSNVSEMP